MLPMLPAACLHHHSSLPAIQHSGIHSASTVGQSGYSGFGAAAHTDTLAAAQSRSKIAVLLMEVVHTYA